MALFTTREIVCVAFSSFTPITPFEKQKPFESTQTSTSPSLWQQLFANLPAPLILVLIAVAISIIVLVLEFRVKSSTSTLNRQEYT